MRVVDFMSGIITACAVGLVTVTCVDYYSEHHDEVVCLAQNIYFEAATEPALGQIAVANVTMNRVKHKAFPDTVCNVVWEPKQFSWTHDGKSDKPEDRAAYKEIYKLAAKVYDGTIEDVTDGALFYHADYIKTPSWTKPMTKVGQIGHHIFYQHDGR